MSECPICKKAMESHIIEEGARFHVHRYSNLGIRCSTENCEDNHGEGKCKKRRSK